MPLTVPGIHGSGTHAARPAGNAVPDGSLYSCTTHNLIYQSSYGGNSWSTWASLTGTGMSNPMTNKGEMIVGDTAGAPSALAAGTSGYVLTAAGAGAFPAWQAPPTAASYTRSSANYTTTSNSFVDVDGTNFALTITTLARRVLITFVGAIAHSSAADYWALDVDVDGARLGGDFGLYWANGSPAAEPQNASFSTITNALTAASHTFKLQWRRNSTGTVTMYGESTHSYARFAVAELA